MKRTGVVIDERYLMHDAGAGHPERPERVEVLLDLVRERGTAVTRVPARLATADDLALVHDGAHVERVAASAAFPRFMFDGDTRTCSESHETALLAAGGVLALLDEVVAGRLDNGFAMVRPPGHHAERGAAMGFCLFNNVAVGAQHLRVRHGLQRILIVDWDLHHGNGTQHLFERDPGVMYVSTHQYPYYPGTGSLDEVGLGDGAGRTVNLPFPAGFGDGEYADAFRQVVEPVAREFAPDFVLISAGFDCHARDPLGGMLVSEDGFRSMARTLLAIARDCAGGRCVAVLEGGYDLRAIHDSAAAVLDELEGQHPSLTLASGERAAPLLQRVRSLQRSFWRL